MKHLRLLTIIIGMGMLFTSMSLSADNMLFRNGKSKYSIVLSTTASTSEQTAAEELQKYIREISGAELPIVNNLKTKGAKIYVGTLVQVGVYQRQPSSFSRKVYTP